MTPPHQDPAKPFRIAVVLWVVVWVGAVGLIASFVAHSPQTPSPVSQTADQPRPAASADGAAAQSTILPAPAPSPAAALLPGLAPSGDVAMPPGATPLAALPAGLPLHPGGKRLLSFQRTDGAWTEQQGVWSIPDVQPAEALDYYQQAAEQRGFKRLNVAAGAAGSRVLGRGGEQLLLRATTSPGALAAAAPAAPASGVRLTVIFRYTDSPTR